MGQLQIKNQLVNREPAPHVVFQEDGKFNALGLGYTISTGFSDQLSSALSSLFEVGYRKMETGELKRDHEEYFDVDNLKLDFSGPFISTGVAVRF